MTGEEYLELGLAYIREKNWESALNTLLESQNRFSNRAEEELPPLLLSSLGLVYAMARNNVSNGLAYCQKALSVNALHPDVHYHLGLVYLKIGDKKKALSAFQKALRLSPRHTGVSSQLTQLGVRKKPVISFLPRNHFLNKYIGIWFINEH
ncbi:MAG: tetratricopeptide repeat protein [Candidatus Manganitrophaceae bacterium]